MSIIAKLEAATLATFASGDAADQINDALQLVALDTFRRGEDGKERKVTVTFGTKQVEDDPQKIVFSVQTKYSIPGSKKIVETVGTDGKGTLFFMASGAEGEVEDVAEAA